MESFISPTSPQLSKGDQLIPAQNRAITLQEAHRTYTAAMMRHDQMVMEAISGNVNELRILNAIERNTKLRDAIGDGIDNMVHASTLIRSLASTWDLTPWIIRLVKEIEQTRAA